MLSNKYGVLVSFFQNLFSEIQRAVRTRHFLIWHHNDMGMSSKKSASEYTADGFGTDQLHKNYFNTVIKLTFGRYCVYARKTDDRSFVNVLRNRLCDFNFRFTLLNANYTVNAQQRCPSTDTSGRLNIFIITRNRGVGHIVVN